MTNCIFCNKRIPTSVGIAIIVLIALLFGAILAWQYWWVPKEEGGVPEIGQYTSWIKDLITKEENEPVANPPALLTRCEYNNKIVYYLPPRCCDAESILFDEKGDVICAPDGGFTGKGDGRCPDFFEERKNCEVIWKDARSYPDETAGWQTYRNEEYGFEIKYPENKTTLIKSEDYGFKISADMYNANIIYVIPVDTNNLIFSPKGSGSFEYDPNTNTWAPFYSGEDICYAFQYLGPDKIPSYYDANLMVDGYPRTNIVITNKGFALKIFRTANDGPVAELQEKIVNTFKLINNTKPLEQNCSNLK